MVIGLEFFVLQVSTIVKENALERIFLSSKFPVSELYLINSKLLVKKGL